MKFTIKCSLIIFFMLLYVTGSAALQWSNVGSANFSGNGVFIPDMAMGPGSQPYAAYNDLSAGNRLTVKKFDGTNWVLVGTAGFSDGGIGEIAIAINEDGVPFVAYSDYNAGGRLTVKSFNGTNWVTLGTSGFSADIVEDKSIAFDTSGQPMVAYKESPFGAEKILVTHYDGTTWQNVGTTGFLCNNTSVASLIVDAANIPYLAYTAKGTNFSNQQVAVRKFDGTSWNIVGGPISFSGGYSPSLAITTAGVLYVCYTDGFPYWLNVKMFDGTSWVSAGNANFSAAEAFYPTLELDNNDVPYVAYVDYGNDYGITVKMLSGPTWTTVGVDNLSDIDGTFPSLAFDAANVPYVGFRWGDDANQPMVVRRFTTVPDFQAGTIATGPHCPGSPVSIPFQITNGVFYPGNVFTAHLSRADGSFATYTYVGTDTGTLNGTINGIFPGDANGTGYRIRIISSNPYAVSQANISDITVQSIHNGLKTFAGIDSDWNNPLNWTPCGMPNMDDSVVIDGAFTVSVPEYFSADGKSVTLLNGADFSLKEGASLNYSGTLKIDSGCAMHTAPSSYVSIRPAARLVVNGTFDHEGAMDNSGTIGGNGTFIQNGNLNNHFGSFISPGNSTGTLNITGDLTLGESTLLIEVNGTTSGTLYDVLNVSGSLSLENATLQIVQGSGFTLTPPYTVSFINAGSITDTFFTTLPTSTVVTYNAPLTGQASLMDVSPLPIKLVDFWIRKNANANILEWRTAMEAHSDKFIIERSNDGQQFEPIGTIHTRGMASQYKLTDDQPLDGKNFYRLQMTAENDNTSYSKTLVVEGSKLQPSVAIRIAPNPAKESFVVSNIPQSMLGNTAVVYDTKGKEQCRFQLADNTTIQTGNWFPGTYFMKVANGQVLRFVKQ